MEGAVGVTQVKPNVGIGTFSFPPGDVQDLRVWVDANYLGGRPPLSGCEQACRQTLADMAA